MIGMIKKDLLMIKNNYKTILIALAIFVFYSIMFEMDMSFFLPFMGLMVCISTINNDEYNNWYTYASTLPQGKSNVVKSKYLTTIGVTIFLTAVSVILSFIISNIKGTLKIDDYLVTIMEELLVIIFLLSVLFPVVFKYGSEKGRFALIIIGFGVFGIVFLFKQILNIEIPIKIIGFIDLYFPVIFVLSSIVMLITSYLISKKMYLKREF